MAAGERERAGSLAEEALLEARSRRSRPGIAECLELQALVAPDASGRRGRLEEALALWRELQNPLGEARVELALAVLSPDAIAPALAARATARLQALGVRPQAAAGAAGLLGSLPPREPSPVAIRTLGGFQVLREGKPVPIAAWRSKKARDLLKILIARRGRPTPRDVLMDILWPEEDPERLGPRLSVLITTVRSVLDPARRFPSDHFLHGDESAIQVDTDRLPIDVEGFLREAETGLALLRAGDAGAARELLALAEAGYTGDFLEEDLYAEWATPLREEARARYVAVARALARAATGAGAWDAAVRYRLRLLQRDPFDEEAHLGLVATLAGAGRHGEALRAYQTYVSRMEELEVEPAPFP
jgi:DNA-binding SARP family transcriptional activator